MRTLSAVHTLCEYILKHCLLVFSLLHLTMKTAPKKLWRDAATVILTARKSVNSKVAPCNTFRQFDYQVLMVKRSSKSKFMPNALVFPGGVLADTDTSTRWLEFFREQGITKDDIDELVLQNVDRPMLMKKDVEVEIARDIALRSI